MTIRDRIDKAVHDAIWGHPILAEVAIKPYALSEVVARDVYAIPEIAALDQAVSGEVDDSEYDYAISIAWDYTTNDIRPEHPSWWRSKRRVLVIPAPPSE